MRCGGIVTPRAGVNNVCCVHMWLNLSRLGLTNKPAKLEDKNWCTALAPMKIVQKVTLGFYFSVLGEPDVLTVAKFERER